MNAGDVVRVAGCTYRQLETWSNAGWLKAANQRKGTGRNRDYPYPEVRVAVKLTRLVQAGVKPAVAARIARGDPAAAAKLFHALLPLAVSVSGLNLADGVQPPGGPFQGAEGDLEAVS